LVEHALETGSDTAVPADPIKLDIAEQYITALHGPLSSDLIVDRLNTITLPTETINNHIYRWYLKARKLRPAMAELKNRLLAPSAPKPDPRLQEYIQQKFPGIELEEVQQAIEKFRHLLHRFTDVEVISVEENLFQIFSRKHY
jgi:hypothetical protein